MSLVPCPCCGRHHGDASCPFCGASCAAKKVIAGVVLAASLVGCPPPVPAYGGPPPQGNVAPRTSASVAPETSGAKDPTSQPK